MHWISVYSWLYATLLRKYWFALAGHVGEHDNRVLWYWPFLWRSPCPCVPTIDLDVDHSNGGFCAPCAPSPYWCTGWLGWILSRLLIYRYLVMSINMYHKSIDWHREGTIYNNSFKYCYFLPWEFRKSFSTIPQGMVFCVNCIQLLPIQNFKYVYMNYKLYDLCFYFDFELVSSQIIPISLY